MTYGVTLNFPNNPPINLDQWFPYMPLGMYFYSTWTNGSPSAKNITWTYPILSPANSTVTVSTDEGYFSGQGASYADAYIRNVSPSKNSSIIQFYPQGTNSGAGVTYSGFNATAMADCANSVSSDSFGLKVTQNKGVESILNGEYSPLVVKARYTFNVPAGSPTRTWDIPYLNRNLNGSQKISVFIGTKNNTYGVHGWLRPRDGKSFTSGARLHTSFFSSGTAANYHHRVWDQIGSVGTLYVLIAGEPEQSGHGFGLAIYGKNGNITFSPENIPVLAKGLATYNRISNFDNYKKYPNRNAFGAPETLPASLQNSTVLMPVGRRTSRIIYAEWDKGDNTNDYKRYYEGSLVKFVKGNTVTHTLLNTYTESSQLYIFSEGYSSINPSADGILTTEGKVPMVRANDYFFI